MDNNEFRRHEDPDFIDESSISIKAQLKPGSENSIPQPIKIMPVDPPLARQSIGMDSPKFRKTDEPDFMDEMSLSIKIPFKLSSENPMPLPNKIIPADPPTGTNSSEIKQDLEAIKSSLELSQNLFRSTEGKLVNFYLNVNHKLEELSNKIITLEHVAANTNQAITEINENIKKLAEDQNRIIPGPDLSELCHKRNSLSYQSSCPLLKQEKTIYIKPSQRHPNPNPDSISNFTPDPKPNPRPDSNLTKALEEIQHYSNDITSTLNYLENISSILKSDLSTEKKISILKTS